MQHIHAVLHHFKELRYIAVCDMLCLAMLQTIMGYRWARVKNAVTWCGYVLTLGFLRLVFYWKPNWHLKATHDECSLSQAEKVLLQVECVTGNVVHKQSTYNSK